MEEGLVPGIYNIRIIGDYGNPTQELDRYIQLHLIDPCPLSSLTINAGSDPLESLSTYTHYLWDTDFNIDLSGV